MGSEERKKAGWVGLPGKTREGKQHSHRQRREQDMVLPSACTKPPGSNSNQSQKDQKDVVAAAKPKVRSKSAFEPTVSSELDLDKSRPSSLTPTPVMSSDYMEGRGNAGLSRRGKQGVGGAGTSRHEKTKTKKKTTGPVHNARYKAKLCKNWAKTGFCPYFEKCQFAHGAQELEKWANRRARMKVSLTESCMVYEPSTTVYSLLIL